MELLSSYAQKPRSRRNAVIDHSARRGRKDVNGDAGTGRRVYSHRKESMMLLFFPLAAAVWRSDRLCFGAGSPVSCSNNGLAGRSGWLTGAGWCWLTLFSACLKVERSTLAARRRVANIVPVLSCSREVSYGRYQAKGYAERVEDERNSERAPHNASIIDPPPAEESAWPKYRVEGVVEATPFVFGVVQTTFDAHDTHEHAVADTVVAIKTAADISTAACCSEAEPTDPPFLPPDTSLSNTPLTRARATISSRTPRPPPRVQHRRSSSYAQVRPLSW